MNKKINIVSFLLLGVLGFVLAFQSLHSLEHLIEQLRTPHCKHKYDHSHTVVSHSHQDFDDCFVCHYSFGDYLNFVLPTIEFESIDYNTAYLFGYIEKVSFFNGSLQNTRAPPFFIV
ncbi:hypothetical protein AX766_00450 [Flavobacterium covae]|uniref:hypothetical protein n=1 Tax=Flavobacterium covae TaxID=2906076 RepID=UPI000745B3EE|nr:hypothetical protein AWN65_07425 [Flavobacterium covae]OXA81035.1 hypothetical protein B0A56_06310 [Flavobacterium columnare NBRC 100251 = ATCC 23463]POR22653.1 hypothetical protein BWK57_05180 [Flavobacterium columnare]AND62996.1 hypothetical protein AX766_00450 [Flavobacterium covae]OWP81304.1 hypothetical protein BWK63_06380 [Flavobacterium covae]